MKKSRILSSALVMTMVSFGAYAADEIITGGAGTCTVDVLGVSADGATANTIATWSLNSYECAAGQYLDETTLNCTECPTGSYCPGGTFTVEANNSKTACPTDYTSDAAATAESECYMGCELACGTNAECPKNATCTYNTSSKVSGKQYVDSSCNAYPSFCPIANLECDAGSTKKTATLTADDASELRNTISGYGASFFEYCSANNVYVQPDSWMGNGCNDSLPPGTAHFNSLDILPQINFEITFSDYGPDTPGIQNFEYTDGDEVFNASYLENANFEIKSSGKYVWIRPIVNDYDAELNSAGMALINNYGTDKICATVQYMDVVETCFSSVPTETLEKFLSTYFNSETELSDFIESDIKPSLSEEEITALDSIPINDLYLLQIVLRTAMLHQDDIISILLIQSCGTVDLFLSEGYENYIKYMSASRTYRNAPWVLPDQSLMQALFIEDGAVLTDEQAALARESVRNAAAAAIAALESKGGLSESYCDANTININWDTGTNKTQGMCYYGSDVLLPIPDPVKPGYTFMGWKLVE